MKALITCSSVEDMRYDLLKYYCSIFIVYRMRLSISISQGAAILKYSHFSPILLRI